MVIEETRLRVVRQRLRESLIFETCSRSDYGPGEFDRANMDLELVEGRTERANRAVLDHDINRGFPTFEHGEGIVANPMVHRFVAAQRTQQKISQG